LHITDRQLVFEFVLKGGFGRAARSSACRVQRLTKQNESHKKRCAQRSSSLVDWSVLLLVVPAFCRWGVVLARSLLQRVTSAWERVDVLLNWLIRASTRKKALNIVTEDFPGLFTRYSTV
jgi:hypothetical protein